MSRQKKMKLAAEHEYGIYAKTVKNNDSISEEDKKYIFEQLMANFKGECSEVGMYLCMARIAHREGYPEIGLYWEKAAFEEAEHAAKFAELLGEDLEPNMKADTKANLAWRVECEFGATQGKFDLATCAKKNGLDAIHDTVHEMGAVVMAQRTHSPVVPYSAFSMGLFHGFRIYKTYNCMSFVGRVLDLSGTVKLDRPYYRYDIRQMDELLTPYLYAEQEYECREIINQHYMDHVGFLPNVGMFLKLTGRLLFRLLTKRKQAKEDILPQ